MLVEAMTMKPRLSFFFPFFPSLNGLSYCVSQTAGLFAEVPTRVQFYVHLIPSSSASQQLESQDFPIMKSLPKFSPQK